MNKIRSQNEIRVFGIRRSGNHAIISWIVDNYPGKVVFINNINYQNKINFPTSPLDIDWKYPFLDRMIIKGLPYWQCKKKFTSWIKYLVKKPQQFTLIAKDEYIDIEYIRKAEKDLFMYSFEDISAKDPRLKLFTENHDKYVGISKNSFDLVIIRDPWNLFSSMIKRGIFKRNEQDKLKYTNLFKDYARYYLDITSQEQNRVVFINYNQWFSDAQYRMNCAQKLGFIATKTPYQSISNRGGGSSFDRLAYNSDASSMKVLERWKVFQDDEFYQSIFTDTELVELATQIFGDFTTKPHLV